jgi:hypothetical protein
MKEYAPHRYTAEERFSFCGFPYKSNAISCDYIEDLYQHDNESTGVGCS